MKKVNWFVVLAGGAVGLAAVLLTAFGNPANMGFCIACFLRDITGALGMHGADKVQYVRPEIVGLVLGAFIMAVATREFRAKAGSSPALRFVLGGFVMIGALAFLGCPLRMVLRLAGGDGNALVGLVGFAIGIFVGTLFMKRGFSLKRAYDVGASEGAVLPVLLAGLLILFLAVPTLFRLSEAGPGSMHAPVLLAFLVALVIGALAPEIPSVHGRRHSGCCFVPGFQAPVRVYRHFPGCSGGESDYQEFSLWLPDAAGGPQQSPVEPAGYDAGRLGFRAFGRLSVASADPGRQRQWRFHGDGVWYDGRRGHRP